MRLRRAWLLVLAAVLVIFPMPVAPVDAALSGRAVTWLVDHEEKTITVVAHIRVFLGPCGELPDGGTVGRGCSDTAMEVGNTIRENIESAWNGHGYKCYRLIFIVEVTTSTTASGLANNDHVGVRLDRSDVPIRSRVHWDRRGGDWKGSEPSDRGDVGNVDSANEPTIWAYPPVQAHEYAHEFGHVLGLHDTYDHKTFLPLPGASPDLMTSGGLGFIEQSTIHRAVERNRDRLVDADSRPVQLEDLECDLRFKVTLKGTETHHGASNLVNSIVDAPCSRQPFTRSTDQTLSVESQPVEILVVEAPDIQPLGYALVPDFDVLNAQSGLLVRVRNNAAAGLFDVPVRVQVRRSSNRPARGEIPPLFDFQSRPCAGGDTGGTPPPLDCGSRTYDSWLAMTKIGDAELWPIASSIPDILKDVGYGSARLDRLYRTCPGQSPWPGAFVEQGSARVIRGTLPSLDDLNKVGWEWYHRHEPNGIAILGGAQLDTVRPGTLEKNRFNWTLILCPLDRDGRAPEGCG